ncbi:MAG: dTMP kinase [Alphaproteobacteria bacterium]|nr:dTMP kinase [Alphaproteobacteria bacterium]
MTRGKFITLEGGEGAGKSTQVKNIAAFLRARGVDVVQTREVGGSPTAEEIRDFWLMKGEGYWDAHSELLLIMAARREHLVKTIWPALNRGAWVVSDRFADSSRAYQGVGLGLGVQTVDAVYRVIAPNFEPDLTLLLDLPVKTGLARMASRGGPDDRYQQKDAAFHQKLREAYLLLAKTHAYRFRVIDASASAKAVGDQIEKTVAGYFEL